MSEKKEPEAAFEGSHFEALERDFQGAHPQLT